MEYYSAMKKNEILPVVTTRMDPEGIMLSEISQTEKDIPYNLTYIWTFQRKCTNKTKQKQTHKHRGQVESCQR